MINSGFSCWKYYVMLASLICTLNLDAQNTYNARLNLEVLDTIERIACYDFELSNSGPKDWILANFNISFFYNAKVACYRSDSLLLSDVLYDNGINDAIAMESGTGIPYEDSLGFIRLGLSSTEQGQTIRADSTWIPAIRVCFDLKIGDITSPSTCFEANFLGQGPNPFNVPASILQEQIDDTTFEEVLPQDIFDNVPNQDYNSCFVVSEGTDALCQDGIDNDEDGLLDCMDSECGPGQFNVNQIPIECFRPLGSIEILGGNANVEFSIDGGSSFQDDSLFNDLTAGVYDIVVKKKSIFVCNESSTIIIQQPDCSEADEASCTDGIDNDADGLVDCEDDSCQPKFLDVIIESPDNCPILNNGIIEIQSDFPNVEFSIDSGSTYIADPIFSNISEGEYYVFIRNLNTLCQKEYDQNPVVVQSMEICNPEPEDCFDGVDNDFDGLIDCDDESCQQISACLIIPDYYLPNIISLSSTSNNEFRLESADPITIRNFSIYDRWGNRIHNIDNTTSGDQVHSWFGTYQNQKVEPGVYIYHFQIEVNGVIINIADNITVIN